MSLAATGATPLAAQVPNYEGSFSDANLFAANVVATGLLAGVAAALDGRPFWRSVVEGGAAGTVLYFGKRITSSETGGMGLLGREVSAVGASMARNAMTGSHMLDAITLPLGPVWLVWATPGRRVPSLRVDLEAVSWTAWHLQDDRHRLDWGRSARAGAFVFTTRADLGSSHAGTVAGVARGGTVLLSEQELHFRPRNLQHELIHVSQIDYLKLAFGDPLERWLTGNLGWPGTSVTDHVGLGVGHYAVQWIYRPWLEAEASRFEVRGR